MNSIKLSQVSQLIKQYAIDELGFSFCAYAKAEFLDTEASHYDSWLSKNYFGQMDYMAQNIDKRLDPTLLVPGAKTVITLMYNYYTTDTTENPEFKISKYAYGRDYHKVIKKKLKILHEYIKSLLGDVQGRGFVDSAPVLERAWSRKSGLGWIGKNAMLINKKHGSFFFLATLIIDHELEADQPISVDHCGTCTRCMDACPTQAIVDNKIIDSNKCISYLTIELKDNMISKDINYNNWVFGCDICQDVCPWNRFSRSHTEPDFDLRANIKYFDAEKIRSMTEIDFNKTYEGSPLRRAGLQGILKNITHISDKNR